MKHLSLLALTSISMFATAALAQAPAAKPGSETQDSLPTVEDQLKVITGRLGLTAGQQVKIKPILRHLHDATQNVMQDQHLSPEQRLAKVRPQRQIADKKMREILSNEQKKKLDQYEQGPHPEMHGTLSGRPNPPDH